MKNDDNNMARGISGEASRMLARKGRRVTVTSSNR